MAQPPAYNREKDFAKDFGNETDHTALNAELDRASNSINDIRANLALIQADDGKIRASSITTDSLDQEVLDYVQATALAGANAVADAATAIAREAQQQAENAVQTAAGAVDKSDEAVTTAHAAQEQAQQADGKADQALGETAQIDGKVSAAVDDALRNTVIPGLTAETIEGALGYVPYDAESNGKDFATGAEVAAAIAAIPEQVNADWNASKGAAAILNKPVLSAVATSGNYADLAGKPVLATVATSGSYNDLKDIPQAIPSGFIGMWSGSADTIPDGWALCDGQNGTPDLSGKFIIGAGGDYQAGDTGGDSEQTVPLSGQTGETTLTIEQMPNHTHVSAGEHASTAKYDTVPFGGTSIKNGSYEADPTNYSLAANVGSSLPTGGSQPHAHSLSGEVSVNTLPPYYARCFIMKL